MKAAGLLALLISAGHTLAPGTTINQVAQQHKTEIETLYKRNFADGLLHQVQFGPNQARPSTRNGQVYLYNETTYIKGANGYLYPAQKTTNLIGDTRLNIVPNSKPLPVVPTSQRQQIVHFLLDNLRLFTTLFGRENKNDIHKVAILTTSIENMNVNKNHITPTFYKQMLGFFPKRIQSAIQTVNTTNVTITPDGTGMSDADQRKVASVIGVDLFNYLKTTWEATNKKTLLKDFIIGQIFTYSASALFAYATGGAATAMPILQFLSTYSPKIKKALKVAKELKRLDQYTGIAPILTKIILKR